MIVAEHRPPPQASYRSWTGLAPNRQPFTSTAQSAGQVEMPVTSQSEQDVKDASCDVRLAIPDDSLDDVLWVLYPTGTLRIKGRYLNFQVRICSSILLVLYLIRLLFCKNGSREVEEEHRVGEGEGKGERHQQEQLKEAC